MMGLASLLEPTNHNSVALWVHFLDFFAKGSSANVELFKALIKLRASRRFASHHDITRPKH